MVKQKEIVPFQILKNETGSFRIVENPNSKKYGNMAYMGDKVVRSPFNTIEEARQREKDIAEEYEYTAIEVENIK